MSATVEPRIQYAKTSDGVNIAYAVFGSGPAKRGTVEGMSSGSSWRCFDGLSTNENSELVRVYEVSWRG